MIKFSVSLERMLLLHVYFLVLSVPIPTILANENPFNLNFQQNDYKIKFEWGQALRYDKRYLKEYDLVVFKYNRTCTAGNLTTQYNIDIGNELELVIQTYRFTSNEYREFPLRFQVNYCVAFNNNLIGGSRATDCGNFKGCPIKKGVRNVICNFAPDPSRFPPLIPSGRYKVEVQGMYRDQEINSLEVYGEVYRPFVENGRNH